jgi:hypothetical protein
MIGLWIYIGIYPAAAAAILTTIGIMLGWRISNRWLWFVTSVGIAAMICRLIYLINSGANGFDHKIFYNVGLDIWSGVDPYEPVRWSSHPILHPPSAFPYFAFLTLLPYQESVIVWQLIDTVLSIGVIVLAWRLLIELGETSVVKVTTAEASVVAMAFALSDACMATLELGQLALRASVVILFAVLALRRGRFVLSGCALELATIKISTLLPFLLLFLRRHPWQVWLACGATTCLLILLGGQPARTFDQARSILQYIGQLALPGAVNDISYSGPLNEWILGIDHLAYRLGVRDRTILTSTQWIVLILLGGWLAYALMIRRIGEGLGLALVSLYSVIFLYHRLYDTVIFAPALVYAFCQAKNSHGKRRVLFCCSTLLMLSLLYMKRRPLAYLTQYVVAHKSIASSAIEFVILPYGTWSVLGAMILLYLAARSDASKDFKLSR